MIAMARCVMALNPIARQLSGRQGLSSRLLMVSEITAMALLYFVIVNE